MKKRIAVGLSGGVDSSLAAYLLKRQGWDVVGFTLKFYPRQNRCCDLDSLDQARRLCYKLDIPHYVLELGDIFKREVIEYFIDTYLEGLTPNPCAYCNRSVKFGVFLTKLKSLGIDYLATGHYARLIKRRGRYLLRCGRDPKKSQEYFLALLNPAVLKHLVFPLGSYTKAKVKRIAAAKKIVYQERKESQDVCFVSDGNYPAFIEANRSNHSDYCGQIEHLNGEVLGRHKGIYYYTYGQRSGLGVGWKEPLFVTAIDSRKKSVIVAEKSCLGRDTFSVTALNWFFPLPANKRISVKVRYNSRRFPCSIELKEKRAQVKLADKINAIAPGQLAAFYHKDLLLGGGIIESDSRPETDSKS